MLSERPPHRRRTRRTRKIRGLSCALLFVLIALVTVVSRPSTAAPSSNDSRAVALFEQAEHAYEQGKFREAIDLLVKARTLRKEPILLFNLARAYESVGDTAKAADTYEGYLEEAPNASDRRAIEERVKVLRRQSAQTDPPPSLPTRTPPDATPPRTGPAPATEVAQPAPHRASYLGPLLVGGAGVLVFGGGALFGIVAQSKADDASREATQRAVYDGHHEAETVATVANVGLIVGGVLLAGAAAWAIVTASTPSRTGATRNPLRVTF